MDARSEAGMSKRKLLTIPQIRQRLNELADEIDDLTLFGRSKTEIAREIRELADGTKRRFGGRRAKNSQSGLTPALKARIKEIAARNPEANYMTIGTMCGCNSGRVSEALTGFREDG